MKPFKGLPVIPGDRLQQVEVSVEAIRLTYTTLLCIGTAKTEFGMFCCGMRAVLKSFFEEVLEDKEFVVRYGYEDLTVVGLAGLFYEWYEETKTKQTIYEETEEGMARNMKYGAQVMQRVENIIKQREEKEKEEE